MIYCEGVAVTPIVLIWRRHIDLMRATSSACMPTLR
jgi:hypothetical protein